MTTGSATLLIVDDEPHIPRVLKVKFTKAGFRVLTAYDGQAAWELLHRESVDLVITDYQMITLNGIELARKMYEDAATSDLPVILLTGRSFSLCERDTVGTNIISVVSKPFSPKWMVEEVSRVLSQGVAEVV